VLQDYNTSNLGAPVIWSASNKEIYILQGSGGNVRLKIDSTGNIQIPGILTSQNLNLSNRVLTDTYFNNLDSSVQNLQNAILTNPINASISRRSFPRPNQRIFGEDTPR